jgi:DNA polymerase III alpha subunit
VADICHFAHGQGIPTVGRGSGAGSIVTYLLGITNVCPLRYRLYFERFLHDKRRDLPDLDIDLCWRRRDDVINHVYRTYGADKVAMICTHNTFQARGAFRDAGRAHGLSPEAGSTGWPGGFPGRGAARRPGRTDRWSGRPAWRSMGG